MSYLDVLKNWPDAVEVKNREELHSLNGNECMDSVNRVCDELQMESVKDFPNTIYAAKFFSVKDNKVLYLPYSELYRSLRSNGMCAGNAPEEAMVEGLCEIMERMAIKSIFMDEIAPPAVPEEVLKRYPAYAIIEDARSEGLKVEIRDCSLGKGLPVLGILTINEKNGLYKYNFGSHPDFDFSDYKDYMANRRSEKNEIMMLSRLKRCSEEEKLDLIDFLKLQMNSPKFFNAEENNNWMCEVMGVPVVAPDTKCPQFVLTLVEMSLSKYSDAYEHFMYAYERGYYPSKEHDTTRFLRYIWS